MSITTVKGYSMQYTVPRQMIAKVVDIFVVCTFTSITFLLLHWNLSMNF